MKAKQIATIVATILFATAAYSGEKNHEKIEIKVIADGEESGTHFVLDSDDLDFDLHEMQVGENRSIVDKEGQSVLVTRTEGGFTFNVDGKTIDILAPESHGDRQVWVSKGDHMESVDVDVHVMHDGEAPHAMRTKRHKMAMAPHMKGMEGVMIISDKEIDEATQQLIRTTLESAGHESVHFAGGHDGGLHQVHVIKKVVEVTE